MTSVFESLLATEATIGTIFFTFFLLYHTLEENRQFIPPREKQLLLVTMIVIIATITVLSLMLFIDAAGQEWTSPITWFLGFSVGGVWATTVLIFVQGVLAFRRLR